MDHCHGCPFGKVRDGGEQLRQISATTSQPERRQGEITQSQPIDSRTMGEGSTDVPLRTRRWPSHRKTDSPVIGGQNGVNDRLSPARNDWNPAHCVISNQDHVPRSKEVLADRAMIRIMLAAVRTFGAVAVPVPSMPVISIPVPSIPVISIPVPVRRCRVPVLARTAGEQVWWNAALAHRTTSDAWCLATDVHPPCDIA